MMMALPALFAALVYLLIVRPSGHAVERHRQQVDRAQIEAADCSMQFDREQFERRAQD